MRIAVTGAGGGIGARLLARLHHAGVPCCGLLRRTSPRLARNPGLDLRRIDFHTPESVAGALEDCTAIVHTALDQTSETTEAMVENNLSLLPPLLTACRRHHLRLVHLSSIAAMPPRITPEVIARDDVFSSETDWYSQTKVAAERWLRAHATDIDLGFVRGGLIYGPYMNWTRAAMTKIQAGPVLLPDGCTAPCYAIHVDDVCTLLSTLAMTPGPLPRLLYAINPEPATWPEFFTGLGMGANVPRNAVDYRPLAELLEVASRREPLVSFSREVARWLWRCPFIPRRLKFSNAVQSTIGLVRPATAAFTSDRSEAGPTPIWPTRFELETYLSTAHFTAIQTSGGLDFKYGRKLHEGLRDSLAWWRGDLASLMPRTAE